MASKPYNGFSAQFRSATAGISRARRGAGEAEFAQCRAATPCAGCGGHYKVAYHGEDYGSPRDSRIPLCKGCHRMVHQRFTRPGAWETYLSLVADGWQYVPGGERRSAAQGSLLATVDPPTFLASLSVEPIDLYVPGTTPMDGHLACGWDPVKVPPPWGDGDWETWVPWYKRPRK